MSNVHPTIDVFVFKCALFVLLDYIDKHLLMSNVTKVGRVMFYTLLKSK